MFSSEPEKANRSFKESAQLAYDCLHALVSNLCERRELTADQAEEYLANPAAWVVKRPFKSATADPKPTSAAEAGRASPVAAGPSTGGKPGSDHKEKSSKEEKGIYTTHMLDIIILKLSCYTFFALFKSFT